MHSRYSHDSDTPLAALAARARELGLDRIALTDHNTAEGSLLFKEQEPDLAIVGEEVKTTEGEVIGLFITAGIRAWKRPEEAMDLIHEMGGIVYVPHPFDRWRAHFHPRRMVELAGRIDVIETYNSWCDPDANEAAAKMALELDKATASGSDAHSPSEMGHSWNEIDPFEGPADFLAKLRGATQHRTELSGSQRRY